MTHQIQTTDGLALAVDLDGPADGAPVVLVHGWPDTRACWRYQVPALADAGFRVITYDQRGFGESDHPATLDGYHVFNAMADIGSILDCLDIDSAHLVGHDWGAPPCWLAAAISPDRVRSLTAVSVGHPRAFGNAGLEQQRRSFYMLLFQFEIAEQWLSDNDWENFRNLLDGTAEIPRMIDALSNEGALTSSLNWYRANMPPTSLVTPQPDLPQISIRTMGVMGADDWALTEEQMTDSAEFVDAEWRYERIDNTAHWIQTEAPQAFNALLLDWLRTE